MRSFQISIFQNMVCTSGSPGVEIRTWGTPGQYFWTLKNTPNGVDSLYNLTGFKNVNLYGASVNGYVRGEGTSATKCAVVQDWMFFILIDGNAPLISGSTSVTRNGFNLYTQDPAVSYYNLGKYTNSIMLSDPITSVKSITFDSIFAQGVGAEFLNSIDLNYRLNFTFYYKYEGED